jgi:hypothetical protein
VGLGALAFGSGEARAIVVSESLSLEKNWYTEVPRSAGGFLVRVSGFGPEAFNADGSLSAEAQVRLESGATVVPLTASAFRTSYYWLTWETPIEPGDYKLIYLSSDTLSPELEQKTLPIVLGSDAEPPTDWGTLSASEACLFDDSDYGGDFRIVVSGQFTPSAGVEQFQGALLTGWLLSNASGSSGVTLWAPLQREFTASVWCSPASFFSNGFERPPDVAGAVVLEVALAGDLERTETLQQQMTLTCGTCDWRAAGASEETVTQWRQAWDGTGGTTGTPSASAGAAGAAPITTAEPIGCGIAPRSRNHDGTFGWFGLLLVLGGSLRRIRSAGSA